MLFRSLKWGDALKRSDGFKEAISKYRQFLAERDKNRDKYHIGVFHVNISICHSKTGNLPAAVTHLETAIKAKKRIKKQATPNSAIMSAFYSLSEASINAQKESIILGFLRKNRGDIVLSPFRMDEFTQHFLKLASAAYHAGMKQTAIQFYTLIPGTTETIEDMEAVLASMGSIRRPIYAKGAPIVRKNLKTRLGNVRKRAGKGQPNEALTLAGNAFMQENSGNIRGAYSIYKQLETHYPKRPKRETQLYNLVRTSSAVGEVLEAEAYGQAFLKAFPASEHVPSVQNLMLSSLFAKGKYDKCIEVASVMLPKLSQKTKQHDICLHVLGGSYYFTGQFAKADPLFKKHIGIYGEKSKFKIAAAYFYGANLSRLQQWKSAATQLDKYLEKYPDPKNNPYLPFALCDRANCHYAEEKEMPQALAKLDRIEKEFPSSGIMDAAFNLKGKIFYSLKEYGKAEKYYTQAHDLAKRRGHLEIAAESTYYLIILLGAEKWGGKDNTRILDAVPHYDLFWKEYAGAGSAYKAQVAVSGLLAMAKAKRSQEALDRLQGVIAEMAKIPGAAGLEKAINSYTEAYLKEHSAEELKDHYYEFPGIDANDRATLALLRIAIIGVYEDKRKEALRNKNQQTLDKANANIKVLFSRLRQDFAPKDLTNYILVRVGDYIRTKTTSPRQALPYYKEVLGRGKDQSYRFPAIFGYAQILGESTKAAERKQAIASLKRVYQDSQKKKEKEEALYRIITTHANGKDWANVAKRAIEYKAREKGYSKFLTPVLFLQAKSYDERKMPDEAYVAYFQLRGSRYGYILYSAPCTKRMMELIWKRNNPGDEDAGKKSDRQRAYEDAWRYINSTRYLLEKMTDKEKALWKQVEALVRKYETSGQVKDMETVKKEEKKKKKRRRR